MAIESGVSPLTKIQTLSQWLQALYDHLLHKRQWTDSDVNRFDMLVRDMHAKWVAYTGENVTPQLHLLTHAVEFAARHRFLGRYSEAQIENYHGQFNIKSRDASESRRQHEGEAQAIDRRYSSHARRRGQVNRAEIL